MGAHSLVLERRIIHVGWVEFAEFMVGHHKPTDLEFESELNPESTRDDDPPEKWFV
jgi:hypothetical protein